MPNAEPADAVSVEKLLAALAAADNGRGSKKPGLVLQSRFGVRGKSTYILQGCVVADGDDTKKVDEPVTITFFTDGNVFQNAQRQYKNFMHKILLRPMIVLDSNDNGTEKFPDGSLLPPFQVSPHTQSIPQWVATKGASATTLIMAQQLEGFVRALSQLHKMGYVHGALHPHSVVFCGEDHGWGFWNLDHMARVGIERRIGGCLKYQPPEVAHAAECGATFTTTDTAADMWAIGVIAYELLTRQPAFPLAYPCAFTTGRRSTSAAVCDETPDSGLPDHARQRVRSQLLGHEPLPWEPESPGAESRLACMGRFRDSVLLCLSRGPRQRPSAERLVQLWREVYLLRYQVR